jgi:hypothetical protein
MSTTSILSTSRQRCGIELEMYVPIDDSHSGRGLASITHAKEFMKEKKIKGFTALRDWSLRNSQETQGVELKFSRPNMLKSTKKKIEQLCDIAEGMKATFMETEGTYIGKRNTYSKVTRNDGGYNGSTGIHVHLEIPEKFSALDFIRLVQFHSDNYDEICKMAWRKDSNRWAPPASDHLSHITNLIENGNQGWRPEEGDFLNSLNKYQGLNLNNISNTRSKKTVEFRYGAGALALNKDAFIDYVEYLKASWDKCFTGETEMEFNGYTLKDVTEADCVRKKKVEVYKDGVKVRDVRFRFKY